MRRDTPHGCTRWLLFQLVTIIVIACICASSVQSTGGDDTKPYYISKIAGKEGSIWKVDGPALEITFGYISSMVQDKNGDLYVTGPRHLVLKFEFDKQEGTWTNVTIIAGTGYEGKGADDVLGTQSALHAPLGLSLIEDSSTDKATALLIAEYDNHRIRKLDLSTQIITTIAGTGKFGFSGDEGLATEAKFLLPQDVFYDQSTGDIYIADTKNHRIRRVRNGTITTVAGKTCAVGESLGDGGQAVDACLYNPLYFTMNGAGEWFIVDHESRIRKVDSNGIITTVAGGGTETGDALATSVKLNNPQSIAFTSSDELLVAENDDQFRGIRKMEKSGFLSVIAGGGSEAPSSNNPIPAKTAAIKPVVLVRDGSDDILVGDNRGFIFKLSNRTKCYGVWSDNDSAVCSGHGSCVGPDECECDDGWTEHDCSVTYCFDIMSNEKSAVCSGHGSCIAPDNCTCDDGWIGSNCSRPSIVPCFGIFSNDTTSVCSGHGSCIDEDQCQCDNGWMGLDCSITHCFGVTSNVPDVVCSGKGKCASHNKCRCDDGYKGHKCQRSQG